MSIDPGTESVIRGLALHHAVARVLNAYCQGVDRRDWRLVRTCYHDDATDSHGAYRGDINGLISFLENRHRNVMSSMHVLSNISATASPQGDAALVESYCLSFQHVRPGAEDPFADASGHSSRTTIACRYIDRFENRPESGWRIARRDVVFEWMRRELDDDYLALDPSWPSSLRTSADALYALHPDLAYNP